MTPKWRMPRYACHGRWSAKPKKRPVVGNFNPERTVLKIYHKTLIEAIIHHGMVFGSPLISLIIKTQWLWSFRQTEGACHQLTSCSCPDFEVVPNVIYPQL